MEKEKTRRAQAVSRRGFLASAGKIAVAATAGAAGLSVIAAKEPQPTGM